MPELMLSRTHEPTNKAKRLSAMGADALRNSRQTSADVAQSNDPVAHIGASRIQAGTLDALKAKWLGDGSFTGLAKTTQALRRRLVEKFCDCRTPSGRRYGDNYPRGISTENIQAAIKGKPPTVQKDWLKALRPFFAFMLRTGDIRYDPTTAATAVRAAKSDGFLTWEIEQVEQYRKRHLLGTMARLALELAINLAARRTDVHDIGRQHLRDGRITWRPSKTRNSTGKQLSIFVLPELQAALDAMPPAELGFVRNEHGQPFASAAAFGNRFADWCIEASLPSVKCDDGKVRNYRCHGLRKFACTRLAEAGATAIEIMQVSGHATLAEAQKYVDAVNQKRMSDAAFAKLNTGTNGAQQVTNATPSK